MDLLGRVHCIYCFGTFLYILAIRSLTGRIAIVMTQSPWASSDLAYILQIMMYFPGMQSPIEIYGCGKYEIRGSHMCKKISIRKRWTFTGGNQWWFHRRGDLGTQFCWLLIVIHRKGEGFPFERKEWTKPWGRNAKACLENSTKNALAKSWILSGGVL